VNRTSPRRLDTGRAAADAGRRRRSSAGEGPERAGDFAATVSYGAFTSSLSRTGVAGIELRQLRYFVTLAEELHFGRAAAREHIVQSGLSQQLQRLERELGVRLLERSTHHVQLTRAGVAFLTEARLLLAHADRAVAAARRAGTPAAALWVGTVDASYDSMPRILRAVRQQHEGLAIHQIEAGVPEQLRLLVEGRLDVGFGRASLAPAEIASELVRLDPMGVLVAEDHRFASQQTVRVAALTEEPVLLGEDERAPEFNQFVVELCRSVGFTPTLVRGTVQSMQAAADLVVQGECVVSTPSSCTRAFPGVVWRPLVDPVAHYPWSLLWRAGDTSEYVQAVRVRTRELARAEGWLRTGGNQSRR
jgi:DNA-binding transcriptional LysR family regulator